MGQWAGGALTGQGGRPELPCRWAAQPASARTRRPQGPHSHRGPGSSAACTGRGERKDKALSVRLRVAGPSLPPTL